MGLALSGGELTVSVSGKEIRFDIAGAIEDLVKCGESWAGADEKELNKKPHYLLRILQRQMFGWEDRGVTAQIKEELRIRPLENKVYSYDPGAPAKIDLILFPGRSSWDYSDSYGKQMGGITSGCLFQQYEKDEVCSMAVKEKPLPTLTREAIESKYGLVPAAGKETAVAPDAGQKDATLLRSADFREAFFRHPNFSDSIMQNTMFDENWGRYFEDMGYHVEYSQSEGSAWCEVTSPKLVDADGDSKNEIQQKDKLQAPAVEAGYITGLSEEMLATFSGASLVNHPCTIGLVLRARSGDVEELAKLERFGRRMEALGRRFGRKSQIVKGLFEWELKDIRYVVYIDDGTSGDENIKRLEEFTRRLSEQGNPRERTFAWVLSDKDRLEKGKYREWMGSLNKVAYLAGLKGEYLPVSWQMLTGPLFANLIDSKSKDGTSEAGRIGPIVDAIMESVSRMTGMAPGELRDSSLGEKLERLRTANMAEIAELFNGISLVLPLARPLTGELDDHFEKDKAFAT